MKNFFRFLLLACATMVAARAQTVNITAPLAPFDAAVPVTISGTLTGSPGTISVTVNNSNTGLANNGVATVSGATWSILWTPTQVGDYSLRAIGTSGTGSTVVVSVTGIRPSIALAVSGGGAAVPYGSARYFNATVSDDGAIDRVEFYYDGGLVGSDTSAPYNFLFIAPNTIGLHTVFAKAIDNAGLNTNSANVTLELSPAIDAVPTVGVTAPITGAFVPQGSATIISGTAMDSDGVIGANGVTVFVNGVTGAAAGLPNSGVATLANGVWSIIWTPVATGVVSISAIAADDKANATVSPEVAVNVTDATSPVLTLALSPLPTGTTTALPPAANNVPTNSSRNVVAAVTSTRSIARVEFFLDGSKVWEDNASPYTYRFFTPSLPGAYVLSARATDSAGLARDTQLNLAVNAAIGQAPTIALLAPISGTTVAPNTAVGLAASALSDGSVASVQFYVNGGTALLGTNNGFVTAAPYLATFTPNAPGTYQVDAIVTDDRGNSRSSNVALVHAVFATPTISITSPRPDPSSPTAPVRVTPNVPLTISATAIGGGGAPVAVVEFLVDGVTIGTRTPTVPPSSTYTFAWTPTSGQLGSHVLTTRVTDANSLSATSSAVNLNVANVVGTPPTVSITAPANTPPSTAAITLQSLSVVNFVANAFATGATNGITAVEFFLNDVSVGTGAREQATNFWRLAYNLGSYDFSAMTPDGNGRYPLTLYAIARDANQNQTISAVTNLSIAPSTSTPPSVGLAAVGNATVTQGTQFQLTATPSDPDGVVVSMQLFVNGVASGPAIPNPAQQVTVNYLPTAAGRFNLYVVVTDDTLNTAVSSPVLLNVNAVTVPVTAMVRPADDTTVTTAGAPVFLEATATSPSTNTLTVTFVAEAASGTRTTVNAIQVPNTTTYRAVWTPTVAGVYTVTSSALVPATTVSSPSGNSRRVTAVSVVGIAPTVTVNAPGNNTTITTASTVNFTATASDFDGSVVGVEFFLGRNSIGQAVRDQLTNTWRLTATFAGLPTGATDIVALARDNAGNVADPAGTTNVNVVNATSAAPTVTISSSTTNAAFSRQVQLTANARDVDGAVIAVQYFANGTNLGTSTNAATNYLVNWTPNQSGTFNVWGVATDNTGNTKVAATIEVAVRRNNPVQEDAAFLLQTYTDLAPGIVINPLVFADLDAQLTAGTLTRAQFAASLTAEPTFAPPVNLLAAYYIIMGQWPTPTNYNTLLPTARTSLPNAIAAILASNEYFAKFGTVPTVALLNNATSAIPARTFLTRLHANAGLGAPSDLDLIRFMNNDTTFGGTLARGYNVAGLTTTLAEFVTNTNSTNAALMKRAQAAALYYQLDRPPVSVTTDQIAARVTALAQLPDTTAIANAVLNDVLYAYRYITFVSHPRSLLVAPRSGAIFSVDAIGLPPLSYQWQLNGAAIAGANGPTLFLTNADTSKVGSYTVVVTSSAASATSDPATLQLSSSPTRLANISTRGPTASGASVLIGGFVVTGAANQTRQMLIRVVGPTLAGPPYNLPGTLADPRLEVYGANPNVPILSNDNWGTQTGGAQAVTAIQQAATRLGAFALAANSADAVILANLAPGSYTVMAKGPTTTASGLVLFEVYDATVGVPAGPKAINVSTRGNVGTSANILIAGVSVNGTVARRVLIRGVGPTLADPRYGLPPGSTLADPQISIVEMSTGRTIKTNDDWGTNADEAAVISAAALSSGAFPLAAGSKDAAMMVMLAPGNYTVQLSGVNGGTGIAIVEVYDVDP